MSSLEQGSINLTSSTVISVNILPYTILGNGQQTVVSSGTAVALATSTSVKTITVKALAANVGLVFVGSSSVSSANGFQLEPGDTISVDLDNLSKVYIDAVNSGDGVSYVYLT